MYLPTHFVNSDIEKSLEVMRSCPLATVISVDADRQPFISHLPVIVEREGDELVCYGHLARASAPCVVPGPSFFIVSGSWCFVRGERTRRQGPRTTRNQERRTKHETSTQESKNTLPCDWSWLSVRDVARAMHRCTPGGRMPKHVLAVGLDPQYVDMKDAPQFTPDVVRAFIDAQLERVRSLGYDVDGCLIDLGETADAVLTAALRSKRFDCVVIGAGLRAPEQVLLFERVINLVHALAPQARFCFNTTPADTAEAVQRAIVA